MTGTFKVENGLMVFRDENGNSVSKKREAELFGVWGRGGGLICYRNSLELALVKMSEYTQKET